MAKKSIASLQTGSKRLTKAIKMVKSEKPVPILLLSLSWLQIK